MNDTMPMLESLLSGSMPSQNTVVLHINHCMDNSFYFTKQLQQAFGKVVFVAVPYNDRRVPKELSYSAYHGLQEKDGYLLLRNNCPIEMHFGDFLSATRQMIQLALEEEIGILLEQGNRLLVVEDGGYHYPVLIQWLSQRPALTKLILGAVEQTTAGIRASGRENLHYPVTSVARSAYKIRIEAYFVADRVVGELKRILHEQGLFIDFHDVLLLGYGIIGRSVALRLAPHHVRLFVCDTDEELRRTAAQDGLAPWNGVFHDDMVVLGNVGRTSFTMEMLKTFLQGEARRIFLASSSSKQVEFEAIFSELEKARRTSLFQGDSYRFSNGKEIVLLAQGFPLNFYDESTDSLTYNMIDPVFSEMLLCAQALSDKERQLQNRIYLFGVDEELGGGEAEKLLLYGWMKKNHLHFDIDTFNRHPQELRLREKALEGDENRYEL